MFELKITIDITPALDNALCCLTTALGRRFVPAVDTQPETKTAPAPVAATPAVPAAQTPAPVPVAQPTAAPAVPVAQTAAPTYTKEQVAAAGAALIQARPETRDALIGLLTQFGVNAINNLPDEHLGAFATALRQLGANI